MKYHKTCKFLLGIILIFTFLCFCVSFRSDVTLNIFSEQESHHGVVRAHSSASMQGVASDLVVFDRKILSGAAENVCSTTSHLYNLIQYILVFLRSQEEGRKRIEVPAQLLIDAENLEKAGFQRSSFEKKIITWNTLFAVTFVILLMQIILVASLLRELVFCKKIDLVAYAKMESYQSIRSFLSLFRRFESKKISNQRSEHFRGNDPEFRPWMKSPPKIVGFFEYFVYPLFHRVASFRPLVSAASGNRPSAVELANMGFSYNKKTSALMCEGCDVKVPLANVESCSSLYALHQEGCQFADKSLFKEDQAEDKHTFEHLAASEEENTYEHLAGSEGRKREDLRASKEHGNSTATIAKGKTIRCLDQVAVNQTTSSEQEISLPQTSYFEEQNQIYHLPEEGAVAGLASQEQSAAAEPACPDQDSEHHPRPTGGCSPREPAAAQQTIEDTPASTASVARVPLGAETQQQANVSREAGEEVGAVGGSAQGDSFGAAAASGNSSVSFDDFEDEHDNRSRHQQELQDASACSKNPGHYSYFPIHNLKPDYLPSSIRHPLVIQYFSVYAKLVVRIIVRKTNPQGPETNSPELFKYGTGLAFANKSVVEDHENNSDNSKWSFIKKYIPLARSKEFIYIKTSPFLISDNHEAQHTEVAFFYENPNKRGVVVAKGVSIQEHKDEMGDHVCVLKCRTSDLSVVEMVKNSELELDSLLQQISRPLQEKLMQRVFIISHPHGNEKMLSYGEYVMVKCEKKSETINGQTPGTHFVKINNNTPLPPNTQDIKKMLLYTADTCQGSSGGLVITFQKRSSPEGEEHIAADVWIHRGVNKKHQLNASTMRELTRDDVSNHGKPLPPRPSFQDDDPNSSSNKVVTCPVYTVTSSPAHPAYADYRKRISSYPESFYHVHTKEALSDAGLFYAGYGDCVRCFHCGLGLRSWRPGDSIYEEHHKNRPDCQFLRLKVKALGIDPFSFQAPGALGTTPNNGTNTLGEHSSSQGDKAESFILADVTSVKSVKSWEKTADQFQTLAPVTPPETTVCMVLSSSPPCKAVVAKSSVEQVLEREQFYLKQLLTCKVCCRNPVKDLFLPCGELVACLDCSKLLTHCPSCHGKILATVTTYFS